jgi:hypothetical protein
MGSWGVHSGGDRDDLDVVGPTVGPPPLDVFDDEQAVIGQLSNCCPYAGSLPSEPFLNLISRQGSPDLVKTPDYLDLALRDDVVMRV